MVSIILYALAALWLLTGFLLGMRRGWKLALFRLGINVCGVAAAILLTRLLSPALLEALSLADLPEELTADPALTELVRALAQMGIAVVCYLAAFFPILWLVRGIGMLVTRHTLEEEERKSQFFSSTGAGLGALSAFLVMCAFLTPISELTNLADTALTAVSAEDGAPEIEELREAVVAPLADHPVFLASRLIGRVTVYAPLTTVRANGVTTNLRIESAAAERLLRASATLSAVPAENWGDDQLAAVSDLIDAVGQSRLIPATAVSLVGAASEAWESGRTFLDMEKPAVLPSMEPTVDLLMETASEMTAESFSQSLHTVCELAAIFHEHGALSAVMGEDEKALLRAFSSEGLITDMILCLSADSSLRLLIPELMNICIRTLGEQIGMSASADAVYADLTEAIADALREGEGMPDAERLSALTDAIYGISEQYGLQVTPAGALYLAARMLDDLGSRTADRALVAAWLASYAASAQGNGGASAYPVSVAAFSLDGAQNTVWGMSDGTLLARGADGSVTTYFTAQAFSAAFDGVAVRIGSHQSRGMLTGCEAGTAQSFRLLTAPRPVTASEAAEANRLCPADAKLTAAVDQIGTLLSGYGEEPFPLPACIRQTLTEGAKTLGMQGQIPESTAAARDALALIRASALQSGLSTGTVQTARNAAAIQTNRVTLDRLLLDSRAIGEAMPEMDCEAISQAIAHVISGMLAMLEGGEEQSLDVALGVLGDMQEALAALRVGGEEPSLISGILQSASVQDLIKVDGGELSGLTDIVSTDTKNAGQVMDDLVSALTAIQSAESDDRDEMKENLSTLLHEVTPVGARAISEVMKPSIVTGLQVSDAALGGVSELVTQVFDRLADVKESGDAESFEAECGGMQALLEIAVTKREAIDESPDAIFGEEGIIGMSADALLQTVMESDVVSESLLSMTAESTREQQFTLSDTAGTVFDLPALDENNREILEAAIETYWDTHAQALPEAKSANDLASVSGGEMTKTDLARRLAAVAAIFGTEYENSYLDLDECAAIRTITLTEGEGSIVLTCMQDGSVSGYAENGGVAGIWEENGTIEESTCRQWLIGEGSAVTVDPALTAANANVTVSVRNLL